jgi:hypothetical protein
MNLFGCRFKSIWSGGIVGCNTIVYILYRLVQTRSASIYNKSLMIGLTVVSSVIISVFGIIKSPSAIPRSMSISISMSAILSLGELVAL